MDRLILEWTLQHAMKYSYMKVVSELYQRCPDLEREPSLQKFISYVSCSKFCLKTRRLDLSHRKIMWHSLRKFVALIPQMPYSVSCQCLEMIAILKWMGRSHIPCEEVYRKVESKLADNSSDVADEYKNLIEKMMLYILCCLEKSLAGMKSCLPTTAIEEIHCSKICCAMEYTSVLPQNPWDRFSVVSAMIKKDHSEAGLLSVVKLLLANSPEKSTLNDKRTSQILHQSSGKMSTEDPIMTEYYKGRALHYKNLCFNLKALCKRKGQDLSVSNDREKAALLGAVRKEAAFPEVVGNPLVVGSEADAIIQEGTMCNSLENVTISATVVEAQCPSNISSWWKKLKRSEDDSDKYNLTRKKFARGDENSDRPMPCGGSHEGSMATEDGGNEMSASPLLLNVEEELEVVVRDSSSETVLSKEVEEITNAERGEGSVASPCLENHGILVSKKETEKIHAGKFSPILEMEEGCLITVVPENEIRFSCSIESASPANEIHDQINVNDVTNNVTGTENLDASDDLKEEGSVNVVDDGEYIFSCHSSSENCDLEMNAPVQDMEVDVPRECERSLSKKLEMPADVLRKESSGPSPSLGDGVGSSVSKGEEGQNLTEGVSPLLIDEEDGCITSVVPENEINFTCSIDYSSQDSDIKNKITEKSVLRGKNSSVRDESEKGGFVSLVAEGDHTFSCPPCDTNSGSERNITVEEKDAELPGTTHSSNIDSNGEGDSGSLNVEVNLLMESESVPSKKLEMPADVLRKESSGPSPSLGDGVGSSVSKGEEGQNLTEGVSPLFIDEEDGCIISVVPENELNFTCSIDYSSQDSDIKNKITEKSVLRGKNSSVRDESEKGGFVSLVAEGDHTFSCPPCDTNSGSERNITVEEKDAELPVTTHSSNIDLNGEEEPRPQLASLNVEVTLSMESESVPSKELEMTADEQRNDILEACSSFDRPEVSSVSSKGKQNLTERIKPGLEKEVDVSMETEGSDYSGQDAEINNKIIGKSALRAEILSVRDGSEKGEFVSLVAKDEHIFIGPPHDSNSGSERNITVDEKDAELPVTTHSSNIDLNGEEEPRPQLASLNVEVTLSMESESVPSKELEMTADEQWNDTSEACSSLDRPEVSSVSNNEGEQNLMERIKLGLDRGLDVPMETEGPDYSSPEVDNDDKIVGKSVLRAENFSAMDELGMGGFVSLIAKEEHTFSCPPCDSISGSERNITVQQTGSELPGMTQSSNIDSNGEDELSPQSASLNVEVSMLRESECVPSKELEMTAHEQRNDISEACSSLDRPEVSSVSNNVGEPNLTESIKPRLESGLDVSLETEVSEREVFYSCNDPCSSQVIGMDAPNITLDDRNSGFETDYLGIGCGGDNEGSINLLTGDSFKFPCSPCSSSSDSEMNVTVQEKSVEPPGTVLSTITEAMREEGPEPFSASFDATLPLAETGNGSKNDGMPENLTSINRSRTTETVVVSLSGEGAKKEMMRGETPEYEEESVYTLSHSELYFSCSSTANSLPEQR